MKVIDAIYSYHTSEINFNLVYLQMNQAKDRPANIKILSIYYNKHYARISFSVERVAFFSASRHVLRSRSGDRFVDPLT